MNKQPSLFQSMSREPAYDGKPAGLFELKNSNCSCVFMDIGASWLSCKLLLAEGEQREVLLGVATMKDFQQHNAYLGVSVGRYANRIKHGRFELDDEAYQLTTNNNGHCLHGGVNGLDKRRWNLVEQSPQHLRFSITSPDGDQGFPGNVKISVTYELTENNQLMIRYQASTDKATPLNLTNHAYFNLRNADAGGDCLAHTLRINSDWFLPVDASVLPRGEKISVASSAFDFREFKTIGQDLLSEAQQQLVKGYDHCFLLNEHSFEKEVAQLLSPDKKVGMKIFTDKPALQLYTGNWLAGTPNRSGGSYGAYAGVALETQFLPDAPNHPEWQQPCILRAGETYSSTTVYQFCVVREG